MPLRNFTRAVTVHLSHEEKVEFPAGIQPVGDDLAEHWHVLANSDPVGEGAAVGEPVAVAEVGIDADAVATMEAELVALKANAAEFDEAYARLTGERDAAAAARDASVAEVEPLKAEVARLAEALAKAEADLEAATAPKGETQATAEAKPHAAKKVAAK